jgi:hypothetical protein
MATHQDAQTEWTKSEKQIFRFFALFFTLQSLPIDLRFFKKLFSTNWLNPYFGDIFKLTKYSPSFTGDDSFINWLIVGVLALLGSLFWDKFYKKEINYDKAYYWVRVIVRYRLAVGLIAYAFLKLFPIQAPLPSLSNLNTNYGDFTAWKLFSLGLGVVPDYQSFLGLVELAGALLLLNRKTATIATLIILPFIGNVAISNIAYEGGEYVYAFYLVSLALYLFAFDGIRLFNLLFLEKPTAAYHFKPVFEGKLKHYRLVLKSVFVLFFIFVYGFKTRNAYLSGGYNFPAKKGIENISGLYNVSQFKFNGTEIPYSKTDSIRWQNVVFEKWNTLSIKSNKPVLLEHLPTEEVIDNDSLRIYEFAGTQGRHYYSYDFDSSKSQLSLKNRNTNFQNDTFNLSLKKLNDSTLVLSGISANRDSIVAVLNLLNKKYLLEEAKKVGRRVALKL